MKSNKVYLICFIAFISMMIHQTQADTQTPLTIVAYGDSLSAGFGLSTNASFPAQLQKALVSRGHNVIVHNAAVSGDTSTSGLSRLSWSLPPKTDLVILELGANDALRGVDPKQTRKALELTLQKLITRKIPVLLTGMLAPPNMGKIYETEFNAIYPFLAKKYGVRFYPFFLKDVAAQPKLNQADGIHPNEKGVSIIVNNMLPEIESLLGSLKKNK